MLVSSNKRLKKDLELIIKRLTEYKPISIILYGGYGRDEGGWFEENNNWQPYNDYDILIVLKKKIPEKIIKLQRGKLARNLDIRWIDLSQKTIVELKNLKPTIFNYDLKYGSKVIYGEKNILDKIPPIDASKLPLEEGNILFKTRMWTFLGSLDKNGFENTISDENSRFFRNQMSKAILAIVDILLLQKGAYDSSYRIRVKRFRELYTHKKELCLLSDWALDEKLKPKAPTMNQDEVKNLYFKVHQFFINQVSGVLSSRFKTKINKPDKLSLLWKYYPINFIRRIGFLCIRRSFNLEKSIILDVAQLYLLYAIKTYSIDEKYLKKANKLLYKLDSSIQMDLAWDQARLLAAKMRIE
jgi:hypothetical protein